jgi:O-antigen/teichoic acid export membrane protein
MMDEKGPPVVRDRDQARGAVRSAPLRPPRNTMWAFVGTSSYALSQGGILLVLTKLGSAALVGRLSFAFAVVAPVTLLLSFHLRPLLTTDPDARRRLPAYLWLRLMSSVAAIGTVGAIGVGLGFDKDLIRVTLIVALAKSIEATSDLLFGFFQRYERHDLYALSLVGKGTCSLAGVALVVSHWPTPSAVIGSLAVVWLAFLVAVDVGCARRLVDRRARPGPRRSRAVSVKAEIVNLARLAWPLSVAAGLVSLQGSVPRFFIQWHLTEYDQGVFASILYAMHAGMVLVGAMGQAMSPPLARHFARGETPLVSRLLRTNLLWASGFGILGVLVAAAVGAPLLDWLYGATGREHLGLLVLTLAAGAVSLPASVLGYAMVAARCIAVQVPLLAVVLLVIIAVCGMAVPHWGLRGAAAGLLAGFAVQLVGSALVLWRALGRSPGMREEWQP